MKLNIKKDYLKKLIKLFVFQKIQKDLLEEYNIDASKISVVYHGVNKNKILEDH